MEVLFVFQFLMLALLLLVSFVLYKPQRLMDYWAKSINWVLKLVARHFSYKNLLEIKSTIDDEVFVSQSLADFELEELSNSLTKYEPITAEASLPKPKKSPKRTKRGKRKKK